MPWNSQDATGPRSYINYAERPDGSRIDRRGFDPSNPQQFAKTYLRSGFDAAQSYFNRGIGGGVYDGQRVAGFSPDQNRYFSGVRQSLGQTPGYMQNAQSRVSNVAGNSGLTPYIERNLGDLRDIANGSNGITTGGQYGQIASMGANNPHFESALNAQMEEIQNRVNASISGVGRYGSGAHTGVLTKKLGDVASKALSDDFARTQALKMQALQGQTGAQAQNLSNQMNAAMSGIGARQASQAQALQAAGMAPMMQQAEASRLRELLQSGSIQQGQRQEELNAARDLFNEQEQAPWNQLSRYMSSLQGGGAVMPQQQQEQPRAGMGQRILGGALTGAGIGGMFGAPLLGAAGGGALGGLFG